MIEEAQLEQVVGLVEREGVGTDTVQKLRALLPDLHFTFCMDDDIANAAPVRERQAFNVYLVDGRNHCLCFTQDVACATGLVLAEVEDD
ncbi:MAG: hypothetical protein KDJ24_13435 [Gammaproteobacteria bacterium]|nr:hypothetical protein [Gammaproteobacteria bacterium]